MELMTRGVRPSSMMSPRQVRGTVLAVLLCSALAGCGSATVSNPVADGAPGPSSAPVTSSDSVTSSTARAAGAAASPAAAAAVGCASVSQATSVTVYRTMHLVEPTRAGALRTTQDKTALVRALFSQLCSAIGHAATQKGVVHCPADFGISYSGTFYDGSRALAKFVYGASGCQTVSITAAGQTQKTMVFGTASAAAPRLQAAMAAVLGEPASMLAQPQSQVNPGGPNKPLGRLPGSTAGCPALR
jgi:hypothetical protein